MIKIFEGSQKSGFSWTSHMQGASRLFELRGPDFHESDTCRLLFLGFRLTGVRLKLFSFFNSAFLYINISPHISYTFQIIHAIGNRKTTYLASPEWTTKPWKGFQKSQEDKLLDIMVKLPSMMEEADAVRSQTQSSSILAATISLSEVCRALVHELKQWHQHWSAVSAQPFHWARRSEIYNELNNKNPGKVLPMALHFVDLETAHLENLYWASLLLIHATFCVTREWVKQFSPASVSLEVSDECEVPDYGESLPIPDLPTITPLSEIHTCAINIAQSFEYFLQPEFGAAGSSLIGFPLMVAMGYFEYFNLPEISWFKVILGRFQDIGIPLGKFLNGMVADKVATLVRE